MRTICCWTIAGTCLALAACDAGLAEPDVGALPTIVSAQFNPQPEPPGRILQFQAAGQLDGRLGGTLVDRATGNRGSLTIETLSAKSLGNTLYLVQSWTLLPPDPVHPPDPVAPITVSLKGLVDLATGKMVLNGATATGVNVLVRGRIVADRTGGISVGGELMFNPQPEPPGQT
jgi:hypothetical protein